LAQAPLRVQSLTRKVLAEMTLFLTLALQLAAAVVVLILHRQVLQMGWQEVLAVVVVLMV
jgi:hypothetical protein